MCWTTRQTPIKQTADKDITVYKIMTITLIGEIRSMFFNDTVWKVGEVKTLCGSIIPYDKGVYASHKFVIDLGFHSFADKPYKKLKPHYQYRNYWDIENWIVGKRTVLDARDHERVFECVIPKGATYYQNEIGEIVSDKIKLVRQVDETIE